MRETETPHGDGVAVMAAERFGPSTSFDAGSAQPLIGVPLQENGREVVRYFADERAADVALAARHPHDARRLAGAWAAIDPDLDWEALADDLDQLRHASAPTPPIDL